MGAIDEGDLTIRVGTVEEERWAGRRRKEQKESEARQETLARHLSRRT